MKPLVYRTVEGVEVHYGPISRKVIAAIDAKFPVDAQPPTYSITAITGDVIEKPHDAETIKDESTSEEERVAWDAYQVKLITQQSQRNEEIVRACLLLGVKDEPPEDDKWLAPYHYLGLDIPDNPHDLKLFWLLREVIKTDLDATELALRIMQAEGKYLEMRAVAASTFRGSVGERNGADAEEPAGTDATERAGVVA